MKFICTICNQPPDELSMNVNHLTLMRDREEEGMAAPKRIRLAAGNVKPKCNNSDIL